MGWDEPVGQEQFGASLQVAGSFRSRGGQEMERGVPKLPLCLVAAGTQDPADTAGDVGPRLKNCICSE